MAIQAWTGSGVGPLDVMGWQECPRQGQGDAQDRASWAGGPGLEGLACALGGCWLAGPEASLRYWVGPEAILRHVSMPG